jgi:hypothetical protein
MPLNRMRAKVFQHHPVSITQIAFQACSFNHSDISPIGINHLQGSGSIRT